MSRLRVAIAQFNAHVGDLAGNAERVLEFAVRARDGGADVLLTPELALSGYPPEDLLRRNRLVLQFGDHHFRAFHDPQFDASQVRRERRLQAAGE